MVLLKLFLLLLLLASAFSIYRAPVKVNRKMPKEFANKQAIVDYFEHFGKKYKNLDSNFGMSNYDAMMYTLNITIGSPPQNFNVTLFNDLADTWIPCKNATYDNNLVIHDHNLFDCDKSSSCKQVSNEYSFPFLSGNIMSDVLCLGNSAVCTDPTQNFGCANSESYFPYHDMPTDGFLGLGFVSANSMIKSVTDQFFNNKVKCPQPVYSFWLNPVNQFADGEFTICGADTDLYQGDIAWKKLLGEDLGYRDNFWTFELDEISVNGYDISGNYYTLIDTYAPIIYGPQEQVADLAQAVGAVPILGVNMTGEYWMQCNMTSSAHNITITLNGTNFVLTPDDYILRINVTDNGGMEICILGIAVADLSFYTYDDNVKDSFWILGDNFIRKFYTVFEKNGTNSRIGFAQPKH